MAIKKAKVDFSKVAANIIKTPLENFVEDSYLPYAHYVIMNRALISDDGLKPVQRRILYAMDQLGLTDKKDYMKAAQIVGETMGKYHPHGDASIGDALARMGQDFSMRVPLIDVQGSVGFTTGDDPAAPRYWEGRPTAAAMELTRDLSLGAVEMGMNYDGKFAEPTILPIKWPNGIINGSQGIAVGYSSNVIPHNPTEVMNAIVALIKNPNITNKGIMKIMPGPDFATGGILIGHEGVKEYYETGRGSFSIRGKYEIIPGARGTHQIIFSEAPYQVSAEQVVKAVQDQKKRDRFKEISSVKDLSDIDNGFKLSISIKAGANPEVVLKDIFRWTPMEQPYSANMNVLKYGVPKVSSVKELLQDFVEFRSECIVNKLNARVLYLDKNIERLTGIITVLVDIDKAIKIIRDSKDDVVANVGLRKHFKINEDQATYILSMQLKKLTRSDSLKIQQDVKDLKVEYKELKLVLSDDKEFNKYMISELESTKKVIGDERRTKISNKTEEQIKEEALAINKAATKGSKNTNCYVTLFSDDTMVRTAKPYKQQRSTLAIVSQVETKSKDNIIFVARDGSALKMLVEFIPEDSVINVDVITGLNPNFIVGLGKENVDSTNHGILIATSKAGVNIVNGGFPNSESFQLVKLDDGETVVSATWLNKSDNESKSIVMISSDAYILGFPVKQVRTSNSGAGTIKGMNLNDGEKLVGVSVTTSKTAEVVTCTHSTLKVTKLKGMADKNRNAKGVLLQRLTKDDEILSAFASDKVVANKNGKSINLPKSSARALPGTKRIGVDITLGHHEIN